MSRPRFLITIDTEGDNAWAKPRIASTRNAAYLDRFQDLCDSFGLKPTYLTNYEMVRCPTFRAFARHVLDTGTGEIGMHLHAWDTPPVLPLTDDDLQHQPYLIEYPEKVMREKVQTMTAILEDTFGVKMISHRSGRWSFDERYARLLVEEGYGVDCSVTPLVSWADTPGSPSGVGGTDFRKFPTGPYWMDLSDVSAPGDSPLLEVPMTVLPGEPSLFRTTARALGRLPTGLRTLAEPVRKVCNRLSPPVRWLRPNGRNRRHLLQIVRRVLTDGRPYAEFMLHSSEFMPDGSPTFRTDADIEKLFADIEALFDALEGRFRGVTLQEFYFEMKREREEGLSA
jgi:hypothetical protein